MSLHKVDQTTNSTTLKSIDTPKTSATATEQLNSTATVFCEACNQIVKAYLANYNENNMFQTINLTFAKKVIKNTKITFSQLVITLVYLNRYYKSLIQFTKHIPGHEEAVIPSLSHVVLICIIQAERYITDIPHKLSWWAGICAGQTKSSDINKWQRDLLNTINYNLYVHPEKDYNVFKVEVNRLAARLINNTAKMPPQFRRSVHLGSQVSPNSVRSSQSNRIPSQPNVVPTESSISVQQRRVLLSPLYSGRSNANSVVILTNQNNVVLTNQTNIIRSPVASNHSIITNQPTQSQNLDVPILNITNTNLTTSPMVVDGSMINQTRSPRSIYTNSHHSIHLDTSANQIQNSSPLPPLQNPNHLMVQNYRRSPVRRNSTTNSIVILNNNNNNNCGNSTNNKQQSSSTNITNNTQITQSPVQYTNNMINSPMQLKNIVKSPVDMLKIENQKLNDIPPKPVKRKRSYYDPSVLSKIVQEYKKTKITMTISPEELDCQTNTSKTILLEENNKKEYIPSLGLINQKVVASPTKIDSQSQDSSSSNKEEKYRFRGDEEVVQSINKGKNRAETSVQNFHTSEESVTSIEENSTETVSASNESARGSLESSENANREEIMYSSMHLANNSITLIPVSPPLTPQ